MMIVKARSKCHVPPCQGTSPRYLVHGGTLKVHLTAPPWTLGRREGPPPTTIPWTFAAKVGGVGGTMVPSNFKSLAGAGEAPKARCQCAFRAQRWCGPP